MKLHSKNATGQNSDSLKATEFLAETHQVTNQPPELQNYNLFIQDKALVKAVEREGAAWSVASLVQFGFKIGLSDYIELGFQANKNKPVLETHDRFGNRIDQVNYHPAYHHLMQSSIESGLHSSPWTNPKKGANVARAALFYLHTQIEAGHLCPITMTHASMATLRKQPEIFKQWSAKVTCSEYDPRNIAFNQKEAVTIGMAMTEKQGGSDVRANTTTAYPLAAEGGGEAYELVGHKYFVSAPMSDAFLMLAQTQSGLSCFLVPRWRPDGSKNAIQFIRLKDKMGNVSNASSETELRGALGWMVGEAGQGVKSIIDMVSLTRFDCMLGSSAAQRIAVAHVTHHCHFRSAFGKSLDQQPLMQNVLTDLILEQQGSLVFSMRMARALDNQDDPKEQLLMRIGTAIGKYWICKRTPAHAYETMECIGGSGLMENSIFPRLLRESPVNAIWEGSGNVQCLDVLRAINKAPQSLEVLLQEIELAKGSNHWLDAYVLKLKQLLKQTKDWQYQARNIVEQLALALQASLLVRQCQEAVETHIAELFCASRLGDFNHFNYGSLPRTEKSEAIIDWARPKIK